MRLNKKSVQNDWYRQGGQNPLLVPLAWLYGRITDFRRRMYLEGRFEIIASPVPVIVVGNISVGGTGKTPVVAWLANRLARDGYKPGIVSRGYGGSFSGKPMLVTEDTEAEEAGDEPVLLARLTGLPVCVSHDRAAGVSSLVDEGVNVVISDDGLQHLRMGRDVEIIVVDGARGFGNGCLLPAGPLRELPESLARADAVLINGGSKTIEGTAFELIPGDATQLNDSVRRPLSEFNGKHVWALAGIGNPGRFYNVLTAHGISYDQVDVPDHGYCDLGSLSKQKRQPILMTAKDAVKYRISDAPNVWYVPVELGIDEVAADKLLELVKQRIKGAA